MDLKYKEGHGSSNLQNIDKNKQTWRQSSNNGGWAPSLGHTWAQPVNNAGPRRAKYYSLPQQPTYEPAYIAPLPPAHPPPPPLSNGWQWGSKNQHSTKGGDDNEISEEEEDDDDDELVEESDEELSDSMYDSEASQKSYETRKQNKWFCNFFKGMNDLTVEQLNETSRQWHCPACQNGPGAIDWYNGLRPLLTHAKTKGAKRAKVHRELAKLIEEELRLKGTPLNAAAGEAFGKWNGLLETVKDHGIVWPPMVVVMNTLLNKDDNDKWLGMGNGELLEYFSSYEAVKARHAYGPHGHRGMSVLIFEGTATGYMEAERLDKHFTDQGTDRDAWEHRPVLFYPGGKRQLYGYLAKEDDIKLFNQHCKGKAMLKYEVRSYQEMVVIPIKQMNEDNQQLTWLKYKVAKQENRSKALEETFHVVSQKLRQTMEENRIVRLRTKMQHDENKEEMDYQEKFFKEQMERIKKDIKEKEQKYEILLREEREKAEKSAANSNSKEKEIKKFIDSQVTEAGEFESERERLIHEHHEKKTELNRRYLADMVELEKIFNDSLTNLMEKYPPSSFATSSNNS